MRRVDRIRHARRFVRREDVSGSSLGCVRRLSESPAARHSAARGTQHRRAQGGAGARNRSPRRGARSFRRVALSAARRVGARAAEVRGCHGFRPCARQVLRLVCRLFPSLCVRARTRYRVQGRSRLIASDASGSGRECAHEDRAHAPFPRRGVLAAIHESSGSSAGAAVSPLFHDAARVRNGAQAMVAPGLARSKSAHASSSRRHASEPW